MPASMTQEAMVQKLIQSSHIYMFIKDNEGRFLMINEAVEELFGVSKDQIIGKTDYDFQSKEQADIWRANDFQVKQSGKALCFQEGGQWASGAGTYISHKFPVDLEGYPNAIGSIIIDITHLEK